MCDKRNEFCYICVLFTDKGYMLDFKNNIGVVEVYSKLFNRSYKFSGWYEPQLICEYCCSTLKKSKVRKSVSLPFSTPMTWNHQLFHKPDDCYFCQTNISTTLLKPAKI